jgi:hypothetical protein
LIQVFTFVTDPDVYREMRRSFEHAGFTPERASFVELRSEGGGGEPEPYSTITELVATVREPFFILCHQDVRLDRGHGIDELLEAIRDLGARDGRWAIAGNAGGSRALRLIRSVSDPHGGGSGDALPARVHSLDENFLVIRSGTAVGCSPGLAGFHLYGTDFCLNALASGGRPYVVDFHLRHLSAGTRDDGYYAARNHFVSHWSTRYSARYVRTSVEVLFMSRWSVLRRVLGGERIRRALKNRATLGATFGSALAPRG